MPHALPVTTLPIYPGLQPTRGSAGFGPVTFGSLIAWLVCSSATTYIILQLVISNKTIHHPVSL